MASFAEAPPGNPKAGEKIFKTKCAQCHTVDKGAGHKQGLDLISVIIVYFLWVLRSIYRNRDPSEIWAMIDYLLSRYCQNSKLLDVVNLIYGVSWKLEYVIENQLLIFHFYILLGAKL